MTDNWKDRVIAKKFGGDREAYEKWHQQISSEGGKSKGTKGFATMSKDKLAQIQIKAKQRKIELGQIKDAK